MSLSQTAERLPAGERQSHEKPLCRTCGGDGRVEPEEITDARAAAADERLQPGEDYGMRNRRCDEAFAELQALLEERGGFWMKCDDCGGSGLANGGGL